MFSSVVQPPILSLFSAASTDCLSLFSTHTDPDLPSDSFVHVLNDETSLPEPPSPQTLVKPADWGSGNVRENEGREEAPEHVGGTLVSGPVLHIQSPTLPRGYIRCPPLHWKRNAHRRARDLGIKLGWLHLQVRNMGRPWSFEVGVVDASDREGRVRCSTFQKQPRIRIGSDEPPLVHIPFRFPEHSTHPLTPWSTVSLHIPSLISHFSSLPSQTEKAQVPLPSGQFSHVSYVKVYATCRLRRIWFTSEKRDDVAQPWEFGLFSK